MGPEITDLGLVNLSFGIFAMKFVIMSPEALFPNHSEWITILGTYEFAVPPRGCSRRFRKEATNYEDHECQDDFPKTRFEEFLDFLVHG
jgi:hypothetical protein